MSRTTHTIREPRTVVRRVAARLSAVALAGAGLTGVLAGTADAATLGEVGVVASASSSTCERTVTVLPMTNEPLTGDFSVYSYAQLYDYTAGRWISTDWMRDDGITHHVFYGESNYYGYVLVTYARLVDGSWTYASDWVPIDHPLDDMWCA